MDTTRGVMPTSDLDSALLRSIVQDAWNSQYTVDSLNHTLVRYQELLVNPLQQLGPDDDSRKQIQTMSVRLPGEVQEITLQSDVASWILEFSDGLELNEIEVLKLLLQAFRMNVDDPRRCENEKETAAALYFGQRQDMLIALLDLIQMVDGCNDFSPELVRITHSFVERLKDWGLITNIIERLRGLSKMKLSIYTPQIDNEIRLLSLILFYAEINSSLESKSEGKVHMALSALTEDISLTIPSVRLHQEHQQEVLAHCHSITTSIYILFTTLMHSMMESGVTALPAWSNKAPASPLASSHLALITLLKSDGHHVESEDFQSNVFNGLAGFGAFIHQLSSLTEVARTDICTRLAKFIVLFLRRHLATVRSWTEHNAMLLLVGSLITDICKVSPIQVAEFWKCQTLPILLHSLDQETPPDTAEFTQYVTLLMGLSSGQHCIRAVQFIGSAKATNWHRIFDIFHKAVAPALKHEQISPLLPVDVRILCDLTRLVQIMARCGPTVNSVSFQQFQVLETLFQMLACAFPVRLKAELFTAVSCWVQGRPAESGQVWDRLEGMQVLATLPESSRLQIPGLVHDLEEIEARDGSYPLTRSFISLLKTLIEMTPAIILEKVGAPLRSPGIGTYIDYVRTQVLAKINGRSYTDTSEKWSLATAALDLLIFLVSPEELDSTGIDILQPIMRSGSPEVRAIVELILGNPDSSSLESALHFVKLAVQHESSIVDRMTRASEESIMLSSVLLRQPETVAFLCQLVGSSSNLAIQAHAVTIVMTLAQRDSTLVVRILSAQHCLAQIRRQWSMQLLMASAEHQLQCDIIMHIINILTDTVSTSWPSFAHILLGFDTTSTNSDAKLMYTADGCLCAVIELIEKPGFLDVMADIAAAGLRLICTLFEDPTTCIPVFEYMSLHHDHFFASCLQNLPLLLATSQASAHRTHHLLQAAWLVKSIALDLHLRRGDRVIDESSALGLLGLSQSSSAPTLMVALLESFKPLMSSDLPEFGGLDRPSCLALGKAVLMSCIDHEPTNKSSKQAFEFLWRVPKLRAASAHVGLNSAAVEKAALAFNENVHLLSASRLISQAWSQLLEIFLLERDLSELKPTLLLDLLIAVLGKISDVAWSPCSTVFANSAVSLMVHIRAVSCSSVITVDHRIVQGVVAGIMHNQNHQTRAQLCAVFFTYMDFMSTLESNSECGGRGREWALSQALSDLNLSASNLIQRISDHAVSNNASIRALATMFLCAYPIEHLIPLLDQSSQLVRFVQTLSSGSDLSSVICPDPANYHQILSLESHLLLLLHISKSIAGARALFAADVLTRLSECDFFAMRPTEGSQFQYADGHPTALQKYFQLVVPFLRLVLSLLTALPHRHDVHARAVDVLLVRHSKPFNAIILSGKLVPEEIEAYHAVSGILLALATGPGHSQSEVISAIKLLLQQLRVQSTIFKTSNTRAEPHSLDQQVAFSFANEITRDMAALCSYLAQRRQFFFEPNIDPRQETGAGATDTLPLGLILYNLLPGATSLLTRSRSLCAQFERALADIHRPAESDMHESPGLTRKQSIASLKASKADERLAVVVIQHCLQVMFLSLQLFGSTTVESKQIERYVHRLREVIDQVDSVMSGEHVDSLVDKQLRRIRKELDMAYGQKAEQPIAAIAPAPGYQLASY